MTRPLDVALEAVLDDAFIKPVVFCALGFDSGVLYVHDDVGTITTLGQDWLGVGDFGGVQDIEQDDTGKPTRFALTLSGVDDAIVGEAIDEDGFNREVIIYLSARDIITGALVADPVEIERGLIEAMPIIDRPDSVTVQVTVESEMVRFDQSLNRYYSDNGQQSEYAGDLCFQYIHKVFAQKLVWAKGQGSIRYGT